MSQQPTWRDHAQLLARARAALETPGDLDAAALAHLIEDISIAEDMVKHYVVPWPIDIHVAHIDHKFGTNVYATHTRKSLMVEVAEYCRDYWSTTGDRSDPFSLSDEEVASAYFDLRDDEFISTERITCLPSVGEEREGE